MEKKQNSFLLVGLGNPGPTYSTTFHNLGFLFLDFHTNKLGAKFSPGRGQYFLTSYNNIFFLKPTTYMNLSGIALKEFFKYNRVAFDHVIVIYDDLDLPKFSVKMKFGGSSGGHRGVESIIYYLESEEFWRVKIGIGKPMDIEPREYVLSPIPEDELKVYTQLFEDMSAILQNIGVKNLRTIQGEINALRKKYVEKNKE